MALMLKRVTNPYECVKCSITKKLISYGEEYLEDDIDGTIVDFNYYYDKKINKKRQEAYDTLVNDAMDRFAYRQSLIQKQRDFLDKTILDRPLVDTDCFTWNKGTYNNDNYPYINNYNAETVYISPKGGK